MGDRLAFVPPQASPQSPQRQTLQSVRLFRAVACLLVVLWHLGDKLGYPKYFNEPAFAALSTEHVSGLFFVLSGFILVMAHWQDVGNAARLPGFLYKRCVRIYPLYWIVLLATWVGGLLLGVGDMPTDPVLLLKSAALLPLDPAIVGGTGAPVLFVAWALQYFMLLYLLFGLLIFNRAAALGLVALVLGWKLAAWLMQLQTPLDFLRLSPFLQFGAGMLVAFAVRGRRWEWAARASLLLGVGAFLALLLVSKLILANASPPWQLELKPAAYALIGALLIFGLVTLERQGRLPRWQAGLQIGDASYALFLIHVPIVSLVCKAGVAVGLAGLAGASLAWGAALAVSLAAAILLHRTVERPLLNASRGGFDWIDHLFDRRKPRRAHVELVGG